MVLPGPVSMKRRFDFILCAVLLGHEFDTIQIFF